MPLPAVPCCGRAADFAPSCSTQHAPKAVSIRLWRMQSAVSFVTPTLRQSSCSQRRSQRCCAQASGAAVGGAQNSTASTGLRTLYPTSIAHDSGYLQVSDLHRIYYEVHGNPAGRPALFVHGGPGAGCYANHARFFDPAFYRIVLVDQRGCGRSTPRGCLVDNTTQALVSDFEALRQRLGIKRWLLLGGSWGVALSLAYARAHPARVAGLVLRGVCLMRDLEVDWLFRGGVAALQPRGWEAFVSLLSEEERSNPVAAYYARMTSADRATQEAAARAWSGLNMSVYTAQPGVLQVWDGAAWQRSDFPPPPTATASELPPPPLHSRSSTGSGAPSSSASTAPGTAPPRAPNGADGNGAGTPAAVPAAAAPTGGPATTAASAGSSATHGGGSSSSSSGNGSSGGAGSAGGDVPSFVVQPLLECHYSVHGAFLRDAPLLDSVPALRRVPCIAVQGRNDLVTPVRTAYDLHRAWPEMELHVVPGAGHSMYDAGITHELVQATDRMRSLSWGGEGGNGGAKCGGPDPAAGMLAGAAS